MRGGGQGEHGILSQHMEQQCPALALTKPLHLQQGAPADIATCPCPPISSSSHFLGLIYDIGGCTSHKEKTPLHQSREL